MRKKHIYLSTLLIIIYAVGVVGLSVGYTNMASLTPLTLVISFTVMLANHQGKLKHELIVLVVIFLWGFIAEVAGVATGKIFGEYQYGNNLGIKLFSVPLVIGINWSLLVYSTAQVARVLLSSVFPAACVGSILMVVLDFLIEPVAIKLDFWQWNHNQIPVQNYIAWFLVAFIAHLSYLKLSPKTTLNKLAVVLLILQFLFFGILHLTLKA